MEKSFIRFWFENGEGCNYGSSRSSSLLRLYVVVLGTVSVVLLGVGLPLDVVVLVIDTDRSLRNPIKESLFATLCVFVCSNQATGGGGSSVVVN